MRNRLVLFCVLTFSGIHSQSVSSANEGAVKGYLDAYYEYNFNQPSPKDNAATKLRNFDVQDNQFSLASAELTYKRTIENLSFKLELVTGDNTDVMHLSSTGVDEGGKYIGQAIVSYTPSMMKSLTFNFGKMLSHVGWEGAKAKDNWNYSRSLLYAFAGPYWHNGLNVSWTTISEVLTANLYIYNGWSTSNDTNRGKTLGIQLAYTPVGGVTFVYNAIGGPEKEDNERDKKIVHDFIISWVASELLAFSADWALGTEDDAIVDEVTGEESMAHWSGLQMALRYSPIPDFYVSSRIESYWDREGYTTGTSQTIREATLTASWKVVPQLELRMEGRQDISTRKSYTKDREPVVHQSTLSLSTLVML